MFGFGKGKIEIQLNKLQFSPGETVEGTVTLSMKKPADSKGVFVGLVGEETVSNRGGVSIGFGTSGSSRPSSSSRTAKIFDFELPLDGEKEYPIGEKSYPFKIKIPRDVYTRPRGASGAILKTFDALSMSRSRISWYVTAKLDVPGFDVNKKVQINVA